MKCPECVAEGQKSKVTMSTELPWTLKQWDEEGVEVPNTGRYKNSYSCSKGHKWLSDEKVNDPLIQAII